MKMVTVKILNQSAKIQVQGVRVVVKKSACHAHVNYFHCLYLKLVMVQKMGLDR